MNVPNNVISKYQHVRTERSRKGETAKLIMTVGAFKMHLSAEGAVPHAVTCSYEAVMLEAWLLHAEMCCKQETHSGF